MHNLIEERPKLEKSESLASLVKRLGNPESTMMLYSPCHMFQIPQIDGAIGYHQVGSCAVVIGDPICSPQDIPELTKAFHLHCEASHLKTIYLLAHHDFAHWGIQNGYRTLIEIGTELSIDPTSFHEEHNVRRKVNSATKHGVQVKEYQQFDPLLEKGIKNAIQTWLQERRGPQIHVGTLDLNHNSEIRIFYAQQQDKIVGVLILTPLDRFQGWAESYNIAISNAPVGTTELLMCSTLKSLANENCRFLCLGTASGAELGEIIGLTFFGKNLARLIFKTANWIFKLSAKTVYLNKYRPHSQPIFLLSKDKLTITQLLAIKHILNVKL